MVSVAGKYEPFEAGREHGEIAYYVGSKDGVGERDAFNSRLAQLERRYAGCGEAVEHDDRGEVSSCLVCSVPRLCEHEGSREQL